MRRPAPEAGDDVAPGAPRPIVRRAVGFAISAALFALALAAVGVRREDLAGALEHAAAAPLWLSVTLVMLPPINLVLIAVALWFVTIRYGRVSVIEMNQLVFSAWLLNFLPMKPGLVGRIAYHKRFNDIRVRDTARTLVESAVMSAIAVATLLGVALSIRGASSAWVVVTATTAPAAGVILAALVARTRWVNPSLLLGALAFRYLDILVWVLRYALVFRLIGAELALSDVVLVTAASQLAQLVPFAGNGLGVREWAVGAVGSASGLAMPVALSGDLVNRATEVVLAVPAGLVALAMVSARVRRSGSPRG